MHTASHNIGCQEGSEFVPEPQLWSSPGKPGSRQITGVPIFWCHPFVDPFYSFFFSQIFFLARGKGNVSIFADGCLSVPEY
jgi:hypothetical protein